MAETLFGLFFLFGAYGYFINFGDTKSFNESRFQNSLDNFSDLYIGVLIIVDDGSNCFYYQ